MSISTEKKITKISIVYKTTNLNDNIVRHNFAEIHLIIKIWENKSKTFCIVKLVWKITTQKFQKIFLLRQRSIVPIVEFVNFFKFAKNRYSIFELVSKIEIKKFSKIFAMIEKYIAFRFYENFDFFVRSIRAFIGICKVKSIRI